MNLHNQKTSIYSLFSKVLIVFILFLSASAYSQTLDGKSVVLALGGTLDVVEPTRVGSVYFFRPRFDTISSEIEFLDDYPYDYLLSSDGNDVRVNIDISDSSISIEKTTADPLVGRFGFYFNRNPNISSISINPASTYIPEELLFSSSAITFLASTNLANVKIIYDVQFLPVPEPSSNLMFMLGIPIITLVIRNHARNRG